MQSIGVIPMVEPSAIPADHMNAMYEAWCNGMNKNDLYGCIYHMMSARLLSFCVEDINEIAHYIDCFEYSLEPSDPAFCEECRTVLRWMMATI
jgi:hypothetical protein